MKIVLQKETSKNWRFLKFLYDSIKQGYQTSESVEINPYDRTNIEGRELLSTTLEWDGKKLFFDLSDHAFLWNLDALEQCDLYFKANLHWGIACKFLGEEYINKYRGKIAPFLLFAPDLSHLLRRRSLYNASAIFQKYDVCQVVGVYRNHTKNSSRLLSEVGIDEQCSPDAFHFWIRFWVHKYLSESKLKHFSRLTSKGQVEQEDGLVIHPSIKKYRFFQKIAASRFQFVNIMPHALLPWKAYEGVALDTPLVLDHNPLMEMPEGFEMVENEHYLSLFGSKFEFDLDVSTEDPSCYRLLHSLEKVDFDKAFSALFEKLQDETTYTDLKERTIAFRKSKLNGQNLCMTIEHYLKLLT